MPIELAVRCDKCKKEKEQTNHWFMIRFSDSAFVSRTVTMSVEPFDLHTARNNENFHIFCGEACALKFVSENLKELW